MVGAFQPGSFPTRRYGAKSSTAKERKIACFSSIDLRHFRVGGKAGRPWSNI
jgi:hypothetical protein